MPLTAERSDQSAVPEAARIEWLDSQAAGVAFSKTETTVAQFEACVTAGACRAGTVGTSAKLDLCNWGAPQRASHPMNCIAWEDAQEFCRWAGGRLPTDHEWMAEATGAFSRAFPWGNEDPTCELAVMGTLQESGCGTGHTWPVCSKPRGNSVSGLCDMSGNVWEWTMGGTDNDPQRAIRGGSWGIGPEDLQTPGKGGVVSPEADFGYQVVGFRCVRLGSSEAGDKMAEEMLASEPIERPAAAAPVPGNGGVSWMQSQVAVLDGLMFARTETTLAQYRACVEGGACQSGPLEASSIMFDEAEGEACNGRFKDREDHPVNCVTLGEAEAFCAWVGGRLPTASEWYGEAAVKEVRSYPWGNQPVTCHEAVWGDWNRPGCGRGSTWPVCSLPDGDSFSGLCDMGGNVSEMVKGLFGAEDGATYVMGGDWRREMPEFLRTDKHWVLPSDTRSDSWGFRCVHEAAGADAPKE